jgi:glutamyl-tRNA reductase
MIDQPQLQLVSTNYKNSRIEMWDRFSVNEDQIRAFLDAAAAESGWLYEVAVLSTCNRTEFYFLTDRPGDTAPWILAQYPRIKSEAVGAKEWQPLRLRNEEAVHHLMRVASGVESLVLGENQILSQVKTTHEILTSSRHRFPVLTRLFQEAVRAGKLVRTETRLCQGAVSISLAAVELTKKFFSKIDKQRILLVGAGDAGSLVVRHFHAAGAWQIGIVNRSLERAEALAREFNAKPLPLPAIPRALESVDIVVVATASQKPLLWKEDVAKALKKRSGGPLVMVDISTPRNIDPAVGDLGDVFLYNIENLKTIVDENMEKRRAEIEPAEEIIASLRDEYWSWMRSLQVKPTIRRLAGFFDAIRTQELERIRNKVTVDEFERIDRFTGSLMKKLLHHPIMELRKMSDGQTIDRELIRSAWEMFHLKDVGVPTPESENGEGKKS